MLTPQYLSDLPEPIVELYAKAERAILADMARRISKYDFWIPSADWQYQKLRECGKLHDEIIKELAHLTGKTPKEIEKMITAAASRSLSTDKSIYKAQGIQPPKLSGNKPMLKILQQGYKALTGELKNITQTTARTATKQFERALDDAWMKVQSGAFSADTSIRDAIKDLSSQGLRTIKYEKTGHTDTIEVAVRRAVVTGVNQTCGKVQVELAKEVGADLMELTAHSGARPDHAEWQGKIVSLSGQPGYLSLDDIGYGTGAGFKGWNCRHDWSPYFEGMPRTWNDEQLEKLNEKKFEYNGEKLTEYEATQKQRYFERQIRRWKREEAALKAGNIDSGEATNKVRKWESIQNDFLDQTGLKRQYQKEMVAPTIKPAEAPSFIYPSLDKNGNITNKTIQADMQKFIEDLEHREGKSKIESEILDAAKTTQLKAVDHGVFFAYDPKDDVFLYNVNANNAKDYDMQYVLSHESAHKLDYTRYHIQDNEKFLIGFANSRNRVMSNRQKIENMFYDGGKYDNAIAMSSIISSLTLGRVHGIIGHTVEYYSKNKWFAQREVFADLCALIITKDIGINDLTQNWIKDVYDAFEEVFEQWK